MSIVARPMPSSAKHAAEAWHWHTDAFKARHAPVAVCLAGEARTIVVQELRHNIIRNLIKPLSADAFLVLSPLESGREGAARAGFELTPGVLQSIEHDMTPVAMVLARDSQMANAIQQLHVLKPDEKHEILACIRAHPPPSFIDREKDWRGYFQVGPCSPQLSLALRSRVCLGLIEHAELARGGVRYDRVVTSRPDIALPCRLPSDVFASLPPDVVGLVDPDFLYSMTRAAASYALREVPLARRWNVSTCFSYRDEGNMGLCKRALIHRAGFRSCEMWAKVWVPEKGADMQQILAYPARTRSDYDEKGKPVTWLHPYPPFGNLSSVENPEVPNGHVAPNGKCNLARNKSMAIEMAAAGKRTIVPVLDMRQISAPHLIGE